ncbi:DNase I-like protein, partial [Auricularia subglabra TFB-10046 SS5]
ITHKVLIPGRAILARIEWHSGDYLNILAVYAPTSKQENKNFWDKLLEAQKEANEDQAKVDVLLGDFNFVEDSLDRFPTKLNPIDAPSSFSNIRRAWGLHDGWRKTFPDKIEWTWRNKAHKSMSRIDRIYVTDQLLKASREWDITISSLNESDHSRVLAEIVHARAPETGPGRWTMDARLCKDDEFMDRAEKIAAQHVEDMRKVNPDTRNEEHNVQRIWARAKLEITTIAKKRQRELRSALKSKVNTKMKEREEIKECLIGQMETRPRRKQLKSCGRWKAKSSTCKATGPEKLSRTETIRPL